jgi:hypothetical protein
MPSYTVIFTIKEDRRITVEADDIEAAKVLVEEMRFTQLRQDGDLDDDGITIEDAWEIE